MTTRFRTGHPYPPYGRRRRDLFGLAPGGVYQAPDVATGTGELLPHRFTLTHDPRISETRAVCSLWHFPSPGVTGRLRVTEHPALRSSDFPPIPRFSDRDRRSFSLPRHPLINRTVGQSVGQPVLSPIDMDNITAIEFFQHHPG